MPTDALPSYVALPLTRPEMNLVVSALSVATRCTNALEQQGDYNAVSVPLTPEFREALSFFVTCFECLDPVIGGANLSPITVRMARLAIAAWPDATEWGG